ncbi:Karyopherin transporter [Salix suchowensis]|nr:Karyopherin transporter [Salix suchowensis]
MPRAYIPINPDDPSEVPAPEQVCSIFSFFIWSFLDPVVFLAYRNSHLTRDQLPILADSNKAVNLRAKIFPATKRVWAESLVSQLVFEHALRVRVKSMSNYTTPSSGKPSSPTPEDPETSTGTEPAKPDKSKTEDAGSKEDGNFVGKLTNLMSTDTSNISDAGDFLFLVVYIPLQMAFGILFLYFVLGWRRVIACYVASRLQGVQQQQMKSTDARVQNVTEGGIPRYCCFTPLKLVSALSVARMIKLLGWERRMNDRIRSTREEELAWLWKRKVLGLINVSIK